MSFHGGKSASPLFRNSSADPPKLEELDRVPRIFLSLCLFCVAGFSLLPKPKLGMNKFDAEFETLVVADEDFLLPFESGTYTSEGN